MQSAAADAIEKKGSFTLVISGGSMIKALAQLAADSKASDFSKWHVAWADERNVALSNPDSNFKASYATVPAPIVCTPPPPPPPRWGVVASGTLQNLHLTWLLGLLMP